MQLHLTCFNPAFLYINRNLLLTTQNKYQMPCRAHPHCKNNQILLISLPGFSVFSGFSKHFSESNLLPIFPHTYSERLTGKVETTGIDKLDQS